MKRRVFCLLLSIVLVIGLMPVSVFATTYTDASITALTMTGNNITSATVQFTTSDTYTGGQAVLVVHSAYETLYGSGSANQQAKGDPVLHYDTKSAAKSMANGVNTFTITGSFPTSSKLALWVYYQQQWVCDYIYR